MLAYYMLKMSSWFFTLTRVPAGADFVINTFPPMTDSAPMTVSPPRMDAPE